MERTGQNRILLVAAAVAALLTLAALATAGTAYYINSQADRRFRESRTEFVNAVLMEQRRADLELCRQSNADRENMRQFAIAVFMGVEDRQRRLDLIALADSRFKPRNCQRLRTKGP